MMSDTTSYFPPVTSTPAEKASQVFKNSHIEGTSFISEKLEHRHINEADLVPRYEITLPNGTVWLSDLYYLIDNRIAVIAYVQVDSEDPVIRSFYRSKSQGVWRVLHDYTVKNGAFDWHAKGLEHGHITACLALQKAFEFIEGDNIPKYIEHHELIFAGTARERINNEPYLGTSGKPEALKGNFYPGPGDRLAPEEIYFSDTNEAPDFKNRLASWSKKSDTYDIIYVDIIASHNKRFHYMFCKDPRNRAWIAMVENANGTLTSTGVIKPWILAGDLVTPAYEYEALSNNYGDANDRKGPYIDMFNNYLSKIRIIQDYLRQS
ncbi:hypothetical protein HY469_03100 [Candidatus Roizmanbacteria bacterium]|nr:hypothetical protein [Candidatus Roizmanbacteria bacterium]